MTLASKPKPAGHLQSSQPGYPLRGEVTAGQHGQTRSGQLIPAPAHGVGRRPLEQAQAATRRRLLEVSASQLRSRQCWCASQTRRWIFITLFPADVARQRRSRHRLIQTGSRARWLAAAGQRAQPKVEAFRQQASANWRREAHRKRGRSPPEIRTALGAAKPATGPDRALLAVWRCRRGAVALPAVCQSPSAGGGDAAGASKAICCGCTSASFLPWRCWAAGRLRAGLADPQRAGAGPTGPACW